MRYMSFEDISSFFFQDMGSTSVHGDLTDLIKGAGGGLLSLTDDVSVGDIGGSRSSPRPIKPGPAGSAPRAPGVKRRKGQAKKVICIPAPAAAEKESSTKMNSTTSGVVVPSDLWAWRKYGQKPIKGSPYPRGYYRCSSSKGCLARKQVERSRSDPSMLVITYTAEHNHPWPTHRNSLAGSSRSSNPNNSKKKYSTATTPHHNQQLQETIIKEEENIEEFDRVFNQISFEPLVMLESNNDIEFFDELGGLEPDPMSFFLPSRERVEEGFIENINKDLDPLSYFDWD